MLGMNVFNANAFQPVEMLASLRRIDYRPSFLSGLAGLIRPVPVRTEHVFIEQSSRGFQIVPFSPRGAPPNQVGGDLRNARGYQTLRFAEASRITASELSFVREEGEENMVKAVATEVAARQNKVVQDMQITKEYHLLNLVTQAKVIDSDGTTVKYDWASEFSLSIPAEVDFDLDNATPASGALRKKCTAVRRSIEIALKMGRDAAAQGVRIVGLCGDAFWDDLTAHPEVEKTYLNWQAAADLRNDHGGAWRTFRYGSLEFVNYRGTDAGATGASLSINTDKCKFFPVGTGIFQHAMSPGETFQDIGRPGQEWYSMIVRDKDRDMWADVEMYSYPLFVCTHPNALYQARRT
jgi:hypothetical protein